MRSFDEVLFGRRSVREYTGEPVPADLRGRLLDAALRAPTAGNMMLYSIIEVEDRELKERLAVTCDNQPFIARAPWVLVFLADYQRTMDCFASAGAAPGSAVAPAEADLLLACCDALIAAQTLVVAAEAHGLGSCYIGDVMENWEVHRDLLALPRWTFPVTMLCLGWPTPAAASRRQPPRFARRIVVQADRYRSVTGPDIEEMFGAAASGRPAALELRDLFARKFDSAYAREMRRSVAAMLAAWGRSGGRDAPAAPGRNAPAAPGGNAPAAPGGARNGTAAAN
jgi:FMN reductase (NADPH)/FMN reductase [NAD(P)H]